MGRQVRCEICGMLLGDIREAKLHKKIKYLCSDCLEEICPKDNNQQTGILDKDYDFGEHLSSFFSGGKLNGRQY